MTGHRAAAPLVGGVALLERAISYALGSLQAVVSLSMPTPCSDWDLGALIAHLDDSLAALHEAVEAGHVGLEIPVPVPRPADPAGTVRALRDRAGRVLGAWVNAGGPGTVTVAGSPLTAEVVATAGAVEVTVHGWDVATACGLDHPIPPSLAADLLRFLPLLVTDADRPARFAPPVAIPLHATPPDRLLAHLGRRP